MVKYSKYLFVGLLAVSFSSQAVPDDKRSDLNDFLVEAVIKTKFLFNSDSIVEVDEKNYPDLDQLVTDLSKKAVIEKPLLFLITKKYPGFLDKANACAVGGKDASAIFVGSWIVDVMSKKELEGLLAHEITHIVKNHPLKMFVARIGGFAVVAAISGLLVKQFGFQGGVKNIGAALVAYYVLSIPRQLALSYYIRTLEKEADLGAVDLTGSKKLARSLEKLEAIRKKYLPYSTWNSTKWSERIFADHPQTKTRKEYIEAYIPAQPVSAELAAEVAAA